MSLRTSEFMGKQLRYVFKKVLGEEIKTSETYREQGCCSNDFNNIFLILYKQRGDIFKVVRFQLNLIFNAVHPTPY